MEITDIRTTKTLAWFEVKLLFGSKKKMTNAEKVYLLKKTRMRIGYISQVVTYLKIMTIYRQNGMESIVKKHWSIYEILQRDETNEIKIRLLIQNPIYVQWYCLGLVEHISLRIPTQFGKPNQTQLHSKHLLNA